MEKTQYVFIRDPEYAWVPAIKTGGDSKTAHVKVPQYASENAICCDGGKAAKGWEEDEVPLNDYNKGLLPMQNVNGSGDLRSFADMVNLPFLHEVCSELSDDTNDCVEDPDSLIFYMFSIFAKPGWNSLQHEGSSWQRKAVHPYWRYCDCNQSVPMVQGDLYRESPQPLRSDPRLGECGRRSAKPIGVSCL
jgi:hypothetical protein